MDMCWPFSGGPVVENSNAWDAESTPGWRTKIPYIVGQLDPCTTTREKPSRCNQDSTRSNK